MNNTWAAIRAITRESYPMIDPQILPVSPLGKQLLKMGARGQMIGGSNVDLENIRTRGVRFVDSSKQGTKKK